MHNEAHCLHRCLDSVSGVADEIIVLDCGSTDGTQALARSYGARVEETDWPGFGIQKARALALANGEWVLSIDADEHLSPQLAASIREAVRAAPPHTNGFLIRYQNRWCGHDIRFGDWGDKRHMRLFRREKTHFTHAQVHERAVCTPPFGFLAGVMIHDSIASDEEARLKCRRYAELGAQSLAARDRGGVVAALVHSVWGFGRGFILRFGFLDGLWGWKVAWYNAAGTWRRYRAAGERRGSRPFDFIADRTRS